MKKLIFTAIAMVAFSGVSMAGEIELEKEIDAINKQLATPPQLNIDCIEEASFKLNQYEQVFGCMTGTQATHLFQQYFLSCQNR
jgi:hypothetical protein